MPERTGGESGGCKFSVAIDEALVGVPPAQAADGLWVTESVEPSNVFLAEHHSREKL